MPTRRTFLQATGVSIALPAFESLTQAVAPAAKRVEPMRMVTIASALGMNPRTFFPKSYGKAYKLSPALQPLSKLRDDFTVFSHMDHPGIFTKHGSMNSLLSGVDAKHASAGKNVSVDQVAASHVSYKTRLPSVHISIGGAQGHSWTPSGIKVREEGDPLHLFKKLFVNDSDAAKRARKLELDRQGSVLDLVRDQAKGLKGKINPADQKKLDEYLTAVREAESRIQGMQRWQDKPKPKVDYKAEDAHGSMDYAILAPLMFDMLYLAIQSDTSRVFTSGFGMHNKVIELDGVREGYHGITHHGNRDAKVKQLLIVDRFYIEQMARFMQKLKDTPAGDSNLMDKTMIFFGSGLGDASRHSNRNLPVLIAGGGFKHGGHINAMRHDKTPMPLNNLFTTMLQKFGIETERFHNATGTIGEIQV